VQEFITVFMFIMLFISSAGAEQPAPPTGTGILSGKVLLIQDGKPVPSAVVSLFNVATGPPPDKSAIRRVPEGFVWVRGSGLFKAFLVPGSYNLGVLFRSDQRKKGPPGPDEFFFFPRDEQGDLFQYEVVAGQTTDVGILSRLEPETFPEITNAFVVEGTVYDEQGKPFAGALILVRGDLSTPRPLFISKRTGIDGRYQLKLPIGQQFYLVARENLVDVGRPKSGDFVGSYGGSKPASGQTPAVFSTTGKPVFGIANQVAKGIDITMYKIPDPEEIRKKVLDESEKATAPGSVVSKSPGP
jgi:hypothetical protein